MQQTIENYLCKYRKNSPGVSVIIHLKEKFPLYGGAVVTEQEKWDAVVNNNSAMDGLFYYAVKSTGVFCRPSCRSRRPSRENVLFFDAAEEAMAAGFRPCKRCRPELAAYQPLSEIAREAKRLIECYPFEKERLAEELGSLGVSGRRLTQLYKQEYGMTPSAYADKLRMEAAKERLRKSGASVTDIAYSLGFESLSAFFAFFRKNTGGTPGEFRNQAAGAQQEGTASGVYDTALGQFTVVCRGETAVAVRFGAHIVSGETEQRSRYTDRVAEQIEDYIAGRRKQFTIPLAPAGTEFQMRVWEELIKIPYGETRSYKDIAQAIGQPGASRAVGMANNKNPLPLLIPCHRVIGANGKLSGYAGGVELKQRLLELERCNGMKEE
jgi:AraC family transcriptional regulator of adaptative response/methylated-DNA-[protein]-cysteine methyltransferase